MAAALVVLTGALFAQDLAAPGPARGPGMMGEGRGPRIEWKIGTVVTTEYKKLTGTFTAVANAPSTLKVDGVEYLLFVPRRALETFKSGDALTVEGPVTTVKGDSKVLPFIQGFKLTVNGKEVDLQKGRGDHERGEPGEGGDPFGPPSN